VRRGAVGGGASEVYRERARQRKMDPKKRIGPQKMVVPLKIALYQISLSLSTITLQH
jgi:hypothetical protein